MLEKDAQSYIIDLGLENAHNAVKRFKQEDNLSFTSERKLLNFAYNIIYGYTSKYGLENYRVNMYIVRYDGKYNLLFNDSLGINASPKKIYKNAILDFIKNCSSDEDYILMIETSPNKYEIVTQMEYTEE